MDSFEIKDGHGASLVFHTPKFGDDGFFQSYRVRFTNDVLKMDIEIDGRRCKDHSTGEEEFFSDLAAAWRGWPGTKIFESLEYDLCMIATSDRTGHVDVEISLTKYWPSRSTVIAHLILEVGQLDAIASRGRKFFSQKPAGVV